VVVHFRAKSVIIRLRGRFFLSVRVFSAPCRLFIVRAELFALRARFLQSARGFFLSVRAFCDPCVVFAVRAVFFPLRAGFFRSVRIFCGRGARVCFLWVGKESSPSQRGLESPETACGKMPQPQYP